MKKIQLGGHKKGSPIRGYALVDDEDFEELNKYKWHAYTTSTVYAIMNGKCWGNKKRDKKILMHRIVMKTPEGMETDHINGNGLDNRKENLRVCTKRENQRNRKIHREGKLAGVTILKNKSSTRYIAQIYINGKNEYLGIYPSEKLAHEAFMKMVEKLDK